MLKKDVLATEETIAPQKQEALNASPASSPASLNQETAVEILVQLQKNEATNKEILKAVKFIKSHYFWRWIFNVIKFVFLVMIIVLGIVSWGSIVEFIRTSTDNYVNSSISSCLDPTTLQNLIKN